MFSFGRMGALDGPLVCGSDACLDDEPALEDWMAFDRAILLREGGYVSQCSGNLVTRNSASVRVSHNCVVILRRCTGVIRGLNLPSTRLVELERLSEGKFRSYRGERRSS